MAQKFTNNARALLTAGITSGDTSFSIEVSKADSFPVANTGTDPAGTVGKDWYKAVLQDVSGNIEIVYVRTRTSGSGTIGNVIRGREGTTARAFAAGSVCGLRMTALDYENALTLAANATADAKTLMAAADFTAMRALLAAAGLADLQSQNGTAYLTSGSSTAYTLTPTPAISAYAEFTSFFVRFHTANGAAATLSISGIASPPSLVMQDATGAYVAVPAGRIPANHRSPVSLLSATQALVHELPPLASIAKKDEANSYSKSQTVASVALTDAATITVDAALSNNFKVTLGGNRTLANPTNLSDGQILNFKIKQDATGNRTLAYGSKFKWTGGAAPALTTTALRTDFISAIYYADDDVLLCGFSRDVR